MAQYFAEAGHNVEFISITPFGKSLLSKQKIGRLVVNDMYVLPFSLKSSLIEKINQLYVKWRLFRGNYDVVVLTNPLQYRFIPEKHLAKCTLIYECMDNIPFFYTGLLRERLLNEENKLLSLVDGVVVSSDYLKRKIARQLRDQLKPILTIYNAADFAAFIQNTQPVKLKRPNLVYIGTIGNWIDWDTLKKFAINHPEYTIYMVGPIEHRCKPPPNVVFTGAISHDQVPSYIASGDKMLLPFIRNELTEAVDPVKLYEYIGMSKQVICAYWPELERFCDHVLFYRNYDEFQRYALYKNNAEHSKVNYNFLNKHNWGVRAKEYLLYMTRLANQKNEIKEG